MNSPPTPSPRSLDAALPPATDPIQCLKALQYKQGSKYLTQTRRLLVATSVVAILDGLPSAQHGYFAHAQAAAADIGDFELTRATNKGFIAHSAPTCGSLTRALLR